MSSKHFDDDDDVKQAPIQQGSTRRRRDGVGLETPDEKDVQRCTPDDEAGAVFRSVGFTGCFSCAEATLSIFCITFNADNNVNSILVFSLTDQR